MWLECGNYLHGIIDQSLDTLVPQNNLVSATWVAQNVPIFCKGEALSCERLDTICSPVDWVLAALSSRCPVIVEYTGIYRQVSS